AALRASRYLEAKDAATQALRLTSEETARRDLLGILRACYSQLPGYNVGARFRLIPAARPALAGSQANVGDATHARLAAELIFLGLYDEGASELRLGGFGGARTASVDDAVDESQSRLVQTA